MEDLQHIPKRFAGQIVAKITRLEKGLHGNIKPLTNFDSDYRLRCGDYRVLFDIEDTPSSCIVSSTVAKRMTKTALKTFDAQIARKRREVVRLQEDLGNMLDHLAVIEARAKTAGEKRYSTAEVKKALGL